MNGLTVKNLSQSFPVQSGGVVEALENVSFEAAHGEIVALLGPSGCGKTSLLNIVAGFEKQTAGEVRFDGAVLGAPDGKRAVVFQQPALFDWLTVQGNAEFGLKRRHIAAQKREQLVTEMLALVGLSDFAKAYPYELSGGMQQRTALARALVLEPEILLMDEPFAALDALLRGKMQQLLLEVWGKLGQTILFVTHDIEEALMLAHRVIILTTRPGRIAAIVPLPGEPDTRIGNEPEIAACREQIKETLALAL